MHSKYLLHIAIGFVAVLLISNTTAVKVVQWGPLVFDAATILFPITYIFGDILTEVYGYKAARKVVWAGIGATVLMAAAYALVIYLPAAPFWGGQEAFAATLGVVPRIVLASIVGFFAGEFTNSYILSRMKVWTRGKHLWARTISSTVAGQGVDTVLFCVIAFALAIPNAALFSMILTVYALKVAYEVLATPLTYVIVRKLKEAEGIDVYDRGIDYNPFSLKD